MKILFVTDLYSIDNNNDSKALSTFTENWAKEGHEVVVIRPNFLLNTLIRNKKISAGKIYFSNGVKIFNLNFFSPFLFDVWKKLPKDFNIKDFDVLISHMPSGALFSLRLLEKGSIPYSISVHASDIEVLKNPVYSFYFKGKMLCAYKKANFIAPRSFSALKKIENIIGKGKTSFVASSGVNEEYILSEEEFKNKAKQFKTNEKLIITTVANLKKRKNVDVILKSLSKITNFNFEYRIIGDGKEKEHLKNLTKQLHLENKVKFLGNMPHEKVMEYLKDSNIFAMLSSAETFGLVYLEAIATGNITICAKDEGIDGIIQNSKNGFVCDINSEKLKYLFTEIYNLKEEEIQKILENTRKTALENTIDKACKNYLNNIFH